MNRIFLIISIFFFTLITWGSTSYPLAACTCVGIGVDTAYASADIVFVGRVIELQRKVDTGMSRQGAEYLIATLDASISWKGLLEEPVKVKTAMHGGCGFPFHVEEEYLVYARAINGEYFTDICSRSIHRRLANEDIKILYKLVESQSD